MHVGVELVLIVARNDEQLFAGEYAIEQRQHFLLLLAVIDLFELVEQHNARLARHAIYPIQIDEIAIRRIPALTTIRWQRAFDEQGPDGLPMRAP